MLLLLKACLFFYYCGYYRSMNLMTNLFHLDHSKINSIYENLLTEYNIYLWVTIFSFSLWGEQCSWLIIFDTLRLLSISRTKQFKHLCILLHILFNNTVPLRTRQWKQFYCYSPMLKAWLFRLSAWRLIKHIYV